MFDRRAPRNSSHSRRSFGLPSPALNYNHHSTSPLSPVFDGPHAPGLEAVGAEVAALVLVADGEGEAAVVGADDADGAALVALDRQRAALAAVLGPPVEVVVTVP